MQASYITSRGKIKQTHKTEFPGVGNYGKINAVNAQIKSGVINPIFDLTPVNSYNYISMDSIPKEDVVYPVKGGKRRKTRRRKTRRRKTKKRRRSKRR